MKLIILSMLSAILLSACSKPTIGHPTFEMPPPPVDVDSPQPTLKPVK